MFRRRGRSPVRDDNKDKKKDTRPASVPPSITATAAVTSPSPSSYHAPLPIPPAKQVASSVPVNVSSSSSTTSTTPPASSDALSPKRPAMINYTPRGGISGNGVTTAANDAHQYNEHHRSASAHLLPSTFNNRAAVLFLGAATPPASQSQKNIRPLAPLSSSTPSAPQPLSSTPPIPIKPIAPSNRALSPSPRDSPPSSSPLSAALSSPMGGAAAIAFSPTAAFPPSPQPPAPVMNMTVQPTSLITAGSPGVNSSALAAAFAAVTPMSPTSVTRTSTSARAACINARIKSIGDIPPGGAVPPYRILLLQSASSKHSALLAALAKRGLGPPIGTAAPSSSSNGDEKKRHADDTNISQRETMEFMTSLSATPSSASKAKVPDGSSAIASYIDDCIVVTSERCVHLRGTTIVTSLSLTSHFEVTSPSLALSTNGSTAATSTATPSTPTDHVLRITCDDRQLVYPLPDNDTLLWYAQWLVWYRDRRFSRDTKAEHTRAHESLGNAPLLQSLLCPMLYAPAQYPIYENLLLKLLSQAQQDGKIREKGITSLRLLQLNIPRHVDEAPILTMRSFKGNEYTFDLDWHAPSLSIRLEVKGKKLNMNWELEVEVCNFHLAGDIRLRSLPHVGLTAAQAPSSSGHGHGVDSNARLSCSFATPPRLSLVLQSRVALGGKSLPFQKSIEDKLTTKLQRMIMNAICEKMVGANWHVLADDANKQQLSVALARWQSIRKVPFRYDGTDEQALVERALLITRDAEAQLMETLAALRHQRGQLEAALAVTRNISSSPATTTK